MGVKLRKNCCWVHLMDYDELGVLICAMKRVGFTGEIISFNWQNLPRLGERLKVTVQQPGTTPSTQVSYLCFDNYKKWDQVKKAVYSFRKAKGVC